MLRISRLFTADRILSSESQNQTDGPDIVNDDGSLANTGQSSTLGRPDELEDKPQWDSDPIASMQRLEAVLFLAKGPLTSRKISHLAGLEDGTQARTMVATLNKHFDKVGRAFHVKRVAGGFQMLTRPQFSKWIRRLEHVPKPIRLSPPMIETLTVVAYRQPIIKAEIEAIRGVSCGEILRQLLERRLVKIAGRSPELGRPFLYATSRDFLAIFGLNSLDDLPRADRLAGTGLPQWANTGNDSDPQSADQNQPVVVVDQKPLDSNENMVLNPVDQDQEQE